MKLKALIFYVMIFFIIPLAFAATWNIELLNPVNNTANQNQNVNFSYKVNVTEVVVNTSNTFNCSILNSSDNVIFSVLSGPRNTTNATFYNITIALPYKQHYWKVNCTTMFTSTVSFGVSETRNFNINTTSSYDELSPADGATLDSPDVNFTWRVNVTNINLRPGNALNCSIQGTYNTTAGARKDRLLPGINTTNGTAIYQIIARDDLSTTSWRVNCSNGSIDFFSPNFSFVINLSHTYDSIVPANDATVSGVDVNFSFRINVTNMNLRHGNALNCSINNASSVSGKKSELFRANVTNATAYHRIFSMGSQADFTNVYWNVNCTNNSINLLSPEFNFGMQINPEYTWQVPDDNSRTGNIVVNFSWRPTMIDINLRAGNAMLCAVQNSSNNVSEPKHNLFAPVNTTNNTIQHQIVTLNNRDPVYWHVNCSNGSIDFFSSVYTLGIDYNLETTNVNPKEGETLTSRYINYSWKFESQNINLSKENTLNCTIFRNGTALIRGVNTTNATENNRTFTTANGHYSMITNCTSNLGEIFSNESSERLFTVSEPVGETFLFELLNPGAVVILPSTSVNFSWIVNLTEGFLDTGEQIECGLYNRSSDSAGYSQLFRANMTNGTFYNRTVTMVKDNLHWWFVNCTTPFPTNPPVGLSDTRIFEIIEDAIFYKYSIGNFSTFNITLTTGNTQIAGNLSVAGGTLFIDSLNKRAGIGTIVPAVKLHVLGNTTITGGNLIVGSVTDVTNVTMYSPNGSLWRCGPDNLGAWSCS